jgi:hypothetical protein
LEGKQNDEGFIEKMREEGLRNQNAEMLRSNQIGCVHMCMLGWGMGTERGKKAGLLKNSIEK